MCARLPALVAVLSIVALGPANAISVKSPADRSLPPAGYMDRGMPATDRLWSAQDYEAAADALRQLNANQLPRSASPASSAVMDRLVDPQNLDFCANHSLPLSTRVSPCTDMLKGAGDVLKLYAAASIKDQSLADDECRLLGFLIQAAAMEAGLLDEVIPTLDTSDPTYPVRMAGLKQAKDGLAQVLQGALIALSDRQSLSDAARVHLASILAATFPAMSPELPPLSQTEFEKTLQHFARTDPSANVRAALSGFATP
jgi:hypothetical protein